MDIIALLLVALAVVAGVLSTFATRPNRFGTVGVAVALLAAGLICQFVNLTGTTVQVTH